MTEHLHIDKKHLLIIKWVSHFCSTAHWYSHEAESTLRSKPACSLRARALHECTPSRFCDHWISGDFPWPHLLQEINFVHFLFGEQLTAVWAWVSAMTSASQSWRRSMHREVRLPWVRALIDWLGDWLALGFLRVEESLVRKPGGGLGLRLCEFSDCFCEWAVWFSGGCSLPTPHSWGRTMFLN